MFDEPTLGLDAAARDKFYSLLLEDYEKNPRTIIISTHLIDEVANLFEEIIILNDGKIMLKSEVNKLKEKSYYLIGSDNVLLPLIKDKNIVYKEELGSTKIIGIYDNLTTLDFKYIKDNNIEMNKIPMQKLFIYLTQSIIKEDYVHEPTK
jgi:ABC-2 type transport system ATP-binding protein